MSVFASCENAIELDTIRLLAMENIVNVTNRVKGKLENDFRIFLM
jgi:hypothetical protein